MSSSLIPLGASVVAKWPSTSNYYKARVIDYTDDQNYVCQFLDGSIIALPSKYVDSPEKFQRTTKKISFMHNEQMLLDPAFSFQSTSVSLLWIGIFLYIQHWFHHYHPDRDGSPTYSLLQQYPNAAARYLLGWFGLQLICARYFPHTGSEQLIYIKESQPSIYYKHRSNSLLAFATIGLMMILFREQIPVRELTKSYYLLALFSLGIALTFSIVLLTNRFFSHAGALCVVENGRLHQQDTPFDFHLFLSIRPGIVLWPALNLLLLLTIVQYNRQVSIRFVLSILFQTIYILNVFINETSMIRQSLDISPPSSFDALFTNLCWVPFTATLTSYYIAKSHRPLHPSILLLSIGIFLFGFALQRLAMRQRTSFQSMHPSSTVDAVTVNDRQRILTSGCWRWCRNPHLLAEILMVIGWSLPAGVRHLAPWLYAVYIIGMSVHKARYFDRALRATCTDDAYEDYSAHVKYTLLPFVY